LLLPLGVLIAAGILVGILSMQRRRTPKSENPKSETSESGM
jgi:phosphotransferase system  glucose/maltose/N-acetylglucosamine-specific IIC component